MIVRTLSLLACFIISSMGIAMDVAKSHYRYEKGKIVCKDLSHEQLITSLQDCTTAFEQFKKKHQYSYAGVSDSQDPNAMTQKQYADLQLKVQLLHQALGLPQEDKAHITTLKNENAFLKKLVVGVGTVAVGFALLALFLKGNSYQLSHNQAPVDIR